uniref:EthD family reductase n=1 Tax=Marinobacterium profundum TaxID=1714300 RepID=UPI000830B651|nr:EthD family reductase [Marinobacterium profundum]
MIKVSVMYPKGADIHFDTDYFLTSHKPLVVKLLGDALKGVEVNFGLAGPSGKAAPYIAMTHLTFESMEGALQSFMHHAPRLLADVTNYTNVQPQLQISEIVQ